MTKDQGICPDGLGVCDRGCEVNCKKAMERDGLTAPPTSNERVCRLCEHTIPWDWVFCAWCGFENDAPCLHSPTCTSAETHAALLKVGLPGRQPDETSAPLSEADEVQIGRSQADLAVLKKDGRSYEVRRIAGQALEVIIRLVTARSPVEPSPSLLRPAATQAPPGCHCTERCVAPVVMGRQTPCRDPEKAARFAEKASASISPLDRRVTVCADCLCACCWQGDLYCDQAKTAGTVEKTIRELLQGNVREDSGYWFKDPNTGVVDYDAKSKAKRAWLAENGSE